MSEYIVNTEDGAYVASVEYNIGIEPFMRIELTTVMFNKDKAEKIVRCSDCKHGMYETEDHDAFLCFNEQWGDFGGHYVNADGNGFCAWGSEWREG